MRLSLTIGTVALSVSCSAPPPLRDKVPTEVETPTAPQESPVAAPGSAPLPASAALAPPFEPLRVAMSTSAMGTKIAFIAYTTPTMDEALTKSALTRGLAEIQRIEQLMSPWVASSDVSLLNQNAGEGALKITSDTMIVLEKSAWVSERSEGVFDITFEAMRGLWKFDNGGEARVPRRVDIDRARKNIDFRAVILDREAGTARLARKETRINLGGIAKGYAVDRAVAVLDGAGLPSFIVQAGGDLFIRGRKPDGERFRVGVRDPRGAGPDDVFMQVEVEDHAFSTAGDYERSFILDGKRYHHIIDPRTGYPASACRSVTILAKDAFTADALDDAVFILGPEKGMALIDAQPDAGAVIVDRDNRVTVSPRLDGRVRKWRDPTDGL